MWKFEKEFRKEKPETIGETDKRFDLDNYKDWLESKLSLTIDTLEDVADVLDKRNDDFDLWNKCNTTLFEIYS